MTKVLWFGSKVKTDVGKIRLKHRELFFDGDVKKASVKLVENSFVIIQKTIAQLKNPKSPIVDAAMNRYFLQNDQATVMKVYATLILVQNGMNNGNLSLKTDNSSSERLQGFGLPANVVGRIEGYVSRVGTSKVGDIHVKRSYIMENEYQAIRTFIHEATHRFAETKDFGERGYMRHNGLTFRAPGLTASEAEVNADSYAYFCMNLGYS